MEQQSLNFLIEKSLERFLQTKKKLKEIDSNTLQIPDGSKIYINESLCSTYRDLLIKSKKLWKEGKSLDFGQAMELFE